MSAERSPSGGIDVTAAPGVAFNYRYAFRLPSIRISTAQERHAQMCETLGLARCRITGMRYRLENERDISAMLALKLDPTVARLFGKQATAVVTGSKGMLIDQEISGVDAGASIARADASEELIRDDLARIDAELRRPGMTASTRNRLVVEAAELRARSRTVAAVRGADSASLASTPMVFNYGSGNLIPGFDTTSPIRDALATANRLFVGAIGIMITLLAALLPWALLVGLAWWVIRRFRPGWPGKRQASAPVYVAEGEVTV